MFVFYVIDSGCNLHLFDNKQLQSDYILATKLKVKDFGKKKVQGHKEEKEKVGQEPDWEMISSHLKGKFKEYYPNKSLDETKFKMELDAMRGFYKEQKWCRRAKGTYIPVKNWKSTATNWFSKSFSRMIDYKKSKESAVWL